MISHINNINRNLARAINGIDAKDLMARTGMTHYEIVAACRTGVNTRLKTVERLADALDVSVASLMLDASVETNWYDECRAANVADNLRRLRMEKGWSQGELGKRLSGGTCHTKVVSISRYEAGQRLPNLGPLQELADVFGVEVADLFLPPEGEA